MDSLIDRITRSIAQRGYVGTLRLCAVTLFWRILPRFRRWEAQRERVDAEFDRKYGVDTGGVYRPKSHEVVGQNWVFGGNYQAVEPATFLDVIGKLDLSFDQFTFIDFGSGKGRTLLLASLFPFKRVIGVEYCPELNQIARRNAFRFSPPERRCSRIEAIDSDAAEYELPNEPLLLFLFHPFSEQVMSRVVQNVAQSLQAHPRRMVVVYLMPNLAHLWEATGLFHRLLADPAIFDTAPATARQSHEAAGVIRAAPVLLLQACSEFGFLSII